MNRSMSLLVPDHDRACSGICKKFRHRSLSLVVAIKCLKLLSLICFRTTRVESRLFGIFCKFRYFPGILIMLTGTLFAQPQAILPEKHFQFFEKNCLDCHDSDTRKGRVDLETIPFEIKTLEDAENWQKVLNAINSKEMPPEDKPQPTPQEKTEFLASLSETLVTARDVLSDSGGVATMRRLSRREYENTIRDLLGIPVDAGKLPADVADGAFDTTGSSLYMSSDQIDNYRAIARLALTEAVQFATSERKVEKQRFELEKFRSQSMAKNLAAQASIRSRFSRWQRQVDLAARKPENASEASAIREEVDGKKDNEFYLHWERIDGAPPPTDFGFPDAPSAVSLNRLGLLPYLVEHESFVHKDRGVYIVTVGHAAFGARFHVSRHFPPGDYSIKICMGRVGSRTLPSVHPASKPMTLPAPAPTREFIDLDSGKGRFTLDTFQVQGTIDKPQTVETFVTKTNREALSFILHERGDMENRVNKLNRLSIHATGVPEEPAIWVDWVEVSGPIISEADKESFDRMKDWIARLERNENDSKVILSEFAGVAMRGRDASADFIDKLNTFYHTSRHEGMTQREAIIESMAIVLASPKFVYLAEKPGPSNEISDIELANRLSYFLTGGPPDEALLQAASGGHLKDSARLQAETERLLNQTDREGFVKPFLEQWLGLNRLDFFQFNTQKHPDYTLGVKKSSRREIYETFAWWIRENGSLVNLLQSDTVVINALLADLYQIPGVKGDHFRPVKVAANSPRGGLLGMAAINAKGSNGEDTSPVERGAWVLRKLMNNPPPPAPPNIPQLSRLEAEKLGTRELISMHQEEAQCAQCHRKIDPIGFGLENFDAIGKWRTVDDRKGIPRAKRTIDPSGKIYSGPEFKDFYELRSIIARNYIDDFAYGFAEHLAEYALGRKIGFTDRGFVEEVVGKAKKQNYAIPVFIEALVTSEAFRKKR